MESLSNVLEAKGVSFGYSQDRSRLQNPGPYIARIYNNKGGSYSMSGAEMFHPETLHPNSAWYFEYPQLLDASWTVEEITSQQRLLTTIMGYSNQFDIGFIMLDLSNLSAEEQEKVEPTSEQFEALDRYITNLRRKVDYSPKMDAAFLLSTSSVEANIFRRLISKLRRK